MRNLLATTALIGGLAFAGAAQAATILTFAQVGTADTITGTATGGTSTTITGSMLVNVNGISGPLSGTVPIGATLTLNATSVGAATSFVAGSPPVTFVDQSFVGSFSIISTVGSINLLSGTFSDATFGGGPSLTLSAGTSPGESISFTSATIPASQLLPPEGMSLAFANVTPTVGLDGTTLASFGASVTGDFSAGVPEPASLAVLGVGLLGLGFVARKRSN